MRKICFLLLGVLALNLYADNQTVTVSPIFSEESLPFTVEVVQADFMLPNGLHSYAFGIYEGKWVLIAGRMNGLHGFNTGNNNFPPDQQNTAVYVVDHHKKTVVIRDLQDAASGLTQNVIDSLSVTSPQFYQTDTTLYMTGGYGVITATGEFSTKPLLTAIDLAGIIAWAEQKTIKPASKYIRQTSDNAFQVTGGVMAKIDDNPTLLVFGQNFEGYYQPGSNGDYTRQVRRFTIDDNGKKLRVDIEDPIPANPNPNYRRRDLNVVPIMEYRDSKTKPALVAYSGVFTISGGAWTVPVVIEADGKSYMDNPFAPTTLKQGMNNYTCPTLGLYSKAKRDMYTVFFGGISFGYFDNGQFVTDEELPFINQITTIKRDRQTIQTQYLMDAEYPVIASTGTNPGNTLLFGAGAAFFPKTNVHYYDNGVVKFDHLKKGKIHIGYIVGGIQSTVPNTSDQSDTAGSPYIFKVYLTRK